MTTRILGSFVLVLLLHAPTPSLAQEDYSRNRWIENGHRIEVEVHGNVEFTDDSRGVESISNGGRFQLLEERPGLSTQRIELRPGSDGRIERRYWVDDVPRAFDTSAEEWFRDLLAEVIRRRSSSSASHDSSATASETVEPPHRARPR